MAFPECDAAFGTPDDPFDTFLFAAVALRVVSVFCAFAALLGLIHATLASNLAKARAALKIELVGAAWLVVTIASAITAFFIYPISSFSGPHAAWHVWVSLAGPVSTGIASFIAFSTADQIYESGSEVPRRLRTSNLVAGLAPLLVSVASIAWLVGGERWRDWDRAIARERAEQEELRSRAEERRSQAEELRIQVEELRARRAGSRERRMAECARWVTMLDGPASSIEIFDDPGDSALARNILAHTLPRTHLEEDVSLPCVDDERAPTFDQEERILAAYGRALVMSPELWNASTEVRGSARLLAKRLHPAIPPPTAKDFAESVDALASEVSRASYGRCYLARHLLRGAGAPRMRRCENVEREFLKRESAACARWVTDLREPQSATYVAEMFEKGPTRTLASAIARRKVGDAQIELERDLFVPPCMDIYTEGFVDHPAIEDAYAELSADPDLWRADRLPPKRVVATVTRGRTIPKARARAFAIHAELFARERPIHFLEVALARCAAAKAYSKSEPRFVECDRLEAMVR